MRDMDELFAALAKSRFRSRIKLGAKEQKYLQEKGLEIIVEHGRGFITERLAPAKPKKDGRQTPMKNHPVFIAQHATGTCCRNCLSTWHKIPKGKALTPEQIDYVLAVIDRWLRRQDCLQQSKRPE